jgi:hypothetical protein
MVSFGQVVALVPPNGVLYRFTVSILNFKFCCSSQETGNKRWVLSIKDAFFLEKGCVG